MKIFISVSAAPRFTPGQKVALREANNKWLAGKITEVSSHGVTFKSNDGDEFDIDGKELRWVRAITKSGKRTPYSNEEIKPLFAVKEPVPKERPKVAPAGSDKAVGVRAARTYMKEASDRAARYTEKYLNVKDAGTIQSHIAKKIRNGDYGLLEWKDKKDAAQVKANWSKIYKDEKALITQAKGAGGKFKIPKETEAPAPAVAEPPKAERKPRTSKPKIPKTGKQLIDILKEKSYAIAKRDYLTQLISNIGSASDSAEFEKLVDDIANKREIARQSRAPDAPSTEESRQANRELNTALDTARAFLVAKLGLSEDEANDKEFKNAVDNCFVQRLSF